MIFPRCAFLATLSKINWQCVCRVDSFFLLGTFAAVSSSCQYVFLFIWGKYLSMPLVLGIQSCPTPLRLFTLSMEFSRQEYWSGYPFPSPGDLPDPGIKPGSPAIAGSFFTVWASREALGMQWQEQIVSVCVNFIRNGQSPFPRVVPFYIPTRSVSIPGAPQSPQHLMFSDFGT